MQTAFLFTSEHYWSFPRSSVGKESTCNAGDLGLIPGLGGSSGEGNGSPLQYSCLENLLKEEPGRLQSLGSQESDTNLVTKPPLYYKGFPSGSAVKNPPTMWELRETWVQWI